MDIFYIMVCGLLILKNGVISIQKTQLTQEQYDKAVKAINMKGENGLNQNAP